MAMSSTDVLRYCLYGLVIGTGSASLYVTAWLLA